MGFQSTASTNGEGSAPASAGGTLASPAGNAPRRWQDYLLYPRVLFTVLLCLLAVVLHVAFGIYVWFFQK
jgi:nitrate reductase NapE component